MIPNDNKHSEDMKEYINSYSRNFAFQMVDLKMQLNTLEDESNDQCYDQFVNGIDDVISDYEILMYRKEQKLKQSELPKWWEINDNICINDVEELPEAERNMAAAEYILRRNQLEVTQEKLRENEQAQRDHHEKLRVEKARVFE